MIVMGAEIQHCATMKRRFGGASKRNCFAFPGAQTITCRMNSKIGSAPAVVIVGPWGDIDVCRATFLEYQAVTVILVSPVVAISAASIHSRNDLCLGQIAGILEPHVEVAREREGLVELRAIAPAQIGNRSPLQGDRDRAGRAIANSGRTDRDGLGLVGVDFLDRLTGRELVSRLVSLGEQGFDRAGIEPSTKAGSAPRGTPERLREA